MIHTYAQVIPPMLKLAAAALTIFTAAWLIVWAKS